MAHSRVCARSARDKPTPSSEKETSAADGRLAAVTSPVTAVEFEKSMPHRLSSFSGPLVPAVPQDVVIGAVAPDPPPAPRPRLSETVIDVDSTDKPIPEMRADAAWKAPRLLGVQKVAPCKHSFMVCTHEAAVETLITSDHVGRRVRVRGYCDGTLHFVGMPHAAQSGTWLGIELDSPLGKVLPA